MAKTAEQIKAELRAKSAANGSKPTAESRQPFHVEHSEREPEPSELRALSRPRRATLGDHVQRALPHSVEAEQGILGSMLCDPVHVIPRVAREIGVDFLYVPAHQIAFARLIEHSLVTPKLDISTFTLFLEQVGQLSEVGGPSFVTSLFTSTPSAANVAYYIDIVRDKFTLRQIIAASNESLRLAFEEQEDVPALLELAHRKMEDVKLALAGSLDDVEGFGFEALLKFDPRADPDQLVGHRWLCRGFTCLWAGASGVGKSTLEMQLAIYWGCGLPIFGMKPVRPLKSLIIQAENDLGDTGEQLQGVLVGIAKAEGMAMTETRRALIESNVVINRVIASTGVKFCALLESLVQMHKPDFVWIDPLFAFAGCDLIDAKEAGLFLRENLFPIAVRNRVCIHVMHHVGKPDKDSKAKAGWGDLDFQYLGFGSSEIQNGFRAVNIILPVPGEEKVFRLILSKRGSRAGAKTPDGEFTNNIYLSHAKEGICWLQVDKPEEQAKSGKTGQFTGSHKAEDILAEMNPSDGIKTGALLRLIISETGMSRATFFRLFNELKAARKVRVTNDGWLIATTQNE
jgi:hypothetical protein